MNLLALLYILAPIPILLYAIKLWFILADPVALEARLKKIKRKRGQRAYDMFKKVYTYEYMTALTLFAVSYAFYFMGQILEDMYGQTAPPVLLVQLLGLLCLGAGTYLMSRALKR